MKVKQTKKERQHMTNKMKLGLWSNRIVMFSCAVFVLGIAFGFINESLARQLLPWVFSLGTLYIIHKFYSIYKYVNETGHENNNIKSSVEIMEADTTKENYYDR
ncbi:TPA: hypothetical protein ACNH3V_004905 [Klebsiella pneumoniae]